MSNEEIRQRAAIAVLPECVRETHEVLSNGGKLIEETQAKQAAMMAVAYADELAEKLSNLEQNGKNSKPANFAKSSKDLQELTEFEVALQATIIGFVLPKKKPSVEDVKYWAKKLIDIAYKQFRQDQMSQEFATFTRQEFNEAVDDEIKRRCDAIDSFTMKEDYRKETLKLGFNYYNSALVTHGVSCYKRGVDDAIKKLKGE